GVAQRRGVAGEGSIREVLGGDEPPDPRRRRDRGALKRRGPLFVSLVVGSGDDAAPAAHSTPDQEHDDRADDRADEARRRQRERPTKDESRKRSADERSDDTQDHGAEPAHRIRAGHKRSCDEARDQPDDQENEETPKVHAHTSVFVTGLVSAATVPSPRSGRSRGRQYPRGESNACLRLRRPPLYPLSYGGRRARF